MTKLKFLLILLAFLLIPQLAYAGDCNNNPSNGRFTMVEDPTVGYVYLLDTCTGDVWHNEIIHQGGTRNNVYWVMSKKVKSLEEMVVMEVPKHSEAGRQDAIQKRQ